MRIANEQLSFWSNHIEHCQWRKRRRRQRRRKWAGCAWTMSLNENCASLMQIINMKHCDHHHHHNKSKISSAIATANARTSTMAPEICLVVHEKTTLSSSIEIHNDRYGCLYSTRFTSWWKKDLINLTRSRRPLSVCLSLCVSACINGRDLTERRKTYASLTPFQSSLIEWGTHPKETILYSNVAISFLWRSLSLVRARMHRQREREGFCSSLYWST